MGNILKYNRGTKVVKSLPVKCLAKCITEVLPSGCWQGQRCLIIGGGTSLENFDWSLLDGEKTIGINKAFTKYPAIVNYAMDPPFFDMVNPDYPSNHKYYEIHKAWAQYKGIKVFLKRDRQQRFAEDVYYVNKLDQKAISFDLNQGIYPLNNSGGGALSLAIGFGCKRIGLLGFDFFVKKENSVVKTHWHDGYSGQSKDSFEKNLKDFRMAIEEFAPSILKQGIEVFNLSEQSLLQGFPKINIAEFLKK